MSALFSRKNLRTGASALGGMVVGAVIGIIVQVGVESTGMLGPSVDELLARQETNFEQVNAQLDTLRQSAEDPVIAKQLAQLAGLLQQQDRLRKEAGTQLQLLADETAALKERSLQQSGFASGADVWLAQGESISVGDTDHVFGVTRLWGSAADVNVNGDKARLQVGDSVSAGDCAVFFKQTLRNADKRAGFDVVCG